MTLKNVNLPQGPESAYDRRLSVMLYQYLRDIRQAFNALEATVAGLGGGGGGSAVWTEVEIDFGATPQHSKTFAIADASVSGASNVAVVASGNVATGRSGDDWEWDGIAFAAKPGAGSFVVSAVAVPGPVVGKRKILYQVG